LPIFDRTPKEPKLEKRAAGSHPAWLIIVTWVIALLMVVFMGFSLYRYFSGKSLLALFRGLSKPTASAQSPSTMPQYVPAKSYSAVEPKSEPDTVLPTGSRQNVMDYEVISGDTLFGIAERYELEPESILWANYKTLKDDPHLISLGVRLKIPPVDGILYEWKEGDKLDHIAGLYKVSVDDILLYPVNNLDITNPIIEPGTLIMIPGGYRDLEQDWIVPIVAGDVIGGTTAKIAGPGSCSPSAIAYGTYSFAWPAPYPGQVSGNDYWGGHPAIDAMCYEGDAVFASDSGVVIYAGPISGGYGNMIAIDHMNGYITIYAHLSNWYVSCGQVVGQGKVIGACGSTGNSTGAHLHFEIRQNGGYINPWHVLQ